jgi:sodium-dependent dicarboxylate transporter 2/3/5
MQRWNLHRRVALTLLSVLGTSPRRMVGGFMLATAVLSMWVSNTATTVMMLPIGVSIVELARPGARPEDVRPFGIALMLGIAYAASIGGLATLVGTPPNAFLAGFMNETFDVTIGFAQWMLVGLPLTFVMLPVAWLVLTRVAFRVPSEEIEGSATVIREEATRLGPLRRPEVLTAIVFGLTATAWICRPLLTRTWPGLSDAGIAIGGGLLLFVIPAGRRQGPLLDWKSAVGLPWEVLVLFGGGLSLAGAIRSTGLAEWMGNGMQGLEALPLLVIVAAAATALIFLTELTSNTAATAAFLPILASLAIGIGESPWFLVVPAALAASCAFMLPVATPPNAIVYSSGRVEVPEMARAGIVLNLLFALLIPLLTYGLVIAVFGAEPGVLPDWTSGVSDSGP